MESDLKKEDMKGVNKEPVAYINSEMNLWIET